MVRECGTRDAPHAWHGTPTLPFSIFDYLFRPTAPLVNVVAVVPVLVSLHPV